MRYCTRCNAQKSEEDFSKDQTKTGGRRSVCRTCDYKSRKAYEENRSKSDAAYSERRRALQRIYRLARREGLTRSKDNSPAVQKKIWRADRYISIEEYRRLVGGNERTCAICGSDYDLVIDHDHKSGDVRGILCRKCNAGIGLLKDDPELIRKAASYLDSKRSTNNN